MKLVQREKGAIETWSRRPGRRDKRDRRATAERLKKSGRVTVFAAPTATDRQATRPAPVAGGGRGQRSSSSRGYCWRQGRLITAPSWESYAPNTARPKPGAFGGPSSGRHSRGRSRGFPPPSTKILSASGNTAISLVLRSGSVDRRSEGSLRRSPARRMVHREDREPLARDRVGEPEGQRPGFPPLPSHIAAMAACAFDAQLRLRLQRSASFWAQAPPPCAGRSGTFARDCPKPTASLSRARRTLTACPAPSRALRE